MAGTKPLQYGAMFTAETFATWRKFSGHEKSCHPERSEGSVLSFGL
jgi:hypothetical protein